MRYEAPVRSDHHQDHGDPEWPVMLDAVLIALFLFAAFGIGAWLEQGGMSDEEDYDDDD